jgi:MFS family permease
VLGWFGRGIRGPARDAILADSVVPEVRGRAFGFHRAGDTIGAVVGPVLALLVLGALGATDRVYRQLFLWTLLPGVASAIVFAMFVREPAATRAHLHVAAPHRDGALPARFRHFLIAVGLFGLADFAPTLLMLRATDVLSPTRGAQAATLAVGFYVLRNVIYAASSYPIGALSDRMPRGRLLACGYAVLIPVALGAALGPASTWVFAIVFVLAGLVAGAQDTLEGAIVADLLPPHVRGTGYGALAAVNGLGDLLSSALLGLIWTTTSPDTAFTIAAVLAIGGATAMWRVTRSASVVTEGQAA